ncbi:glycosyltransferase family 2 protein [Chryseolinea sp. T2]|uniref:glycosyltransferase family 2 protein n=1 Tax=Chryseolinea sp. T2 TaxID=3129255 RepID=UPI003077AECE
MSHPPRISIIIATYNASVLLPDLLDSISKQDYPHCEVVVVDGGSKDDTLQVVHRYGDLVTSWISEPDRGIFDAWNKGLRLAKGDWVMFLGSDDCLLPDALNQYVSFIDSLDHEVDFISSRVYYTDKNLVPYRVLGWAWEWPRFQREMTVAHPGSLHSRRLFEKYGVFSTAYRIVGDYEFLLRGRNELRTAFMDKVTVRFREGGSSDSYAAIRECFHASVSTGKSPVVRSLLYTFSVYVKFSIRKFLRKFNLNLYLRRQET